VTAHTKKGQIGDEENAEKGWNESKKKLSGSQKRKKLSSLGGFQEGGKRVGPVGET